MATPSTPTLRIARLLGEGARILAVHPGQSGIDVTYDITALLEAVHSDEGPLESDEDEAAVA